MAEEGACPICGFERLQTDQENCPQCDAELTCFKVLDSITEESANPTFATQSSIVAIQREPSIATLEQELLAPATAVSGAPIEKISPASDTPLSKQESKQNISKTSSGIKKSWISWNLAAAMLTFAVILIAIVAVFQLYHLRRLEFGLQENSRNQKKIASNSELKKRLPEQVSSELAQLNTTKADSTLIEEKTHLKDGILKPKKQSEFSESKVNTDGTRDDKSISLLDKSKLIKPYGKSDSGQSKLFNSGSIENQAEPKIEENFSEHDFQSIIIKTGDTLKSVAETYYGVAKYYPLVIMLNPDLPINLQDGRRLKILNDRRKAAEIFRKTTSKIGNRLYFNYTITQSDTLKGISLKFYRSKRMIKSILDLNPDSQFRVGERIRIRLE